MGWRQPRIGRTVGPLGIDIGHHSIKLAQLALSASGPQLHALACRATPAGIFDADGYLVGVEALGAALRALTDELGVSGSDVVACVSSTAGHVALIDVMARPGEDIGPDALAELAPRLELPITEVATSLRLVAVPPPDAVEPDAPACVKVLACALPSALVAALEQALDAAGLAPLVIESAPLVAGQVCVGDSAALQLVGDLGATQTTWTLWQHGLPIWSKVESIGGDHLTAAGAAALGGDPASAEAWKLSDPWDTPQPECLAAAERYLESLTEAVAVAQEPLEGLEPSVVWLHGGGALLRDLAPRLAESTGLAVEVLDAFARMGVDSAGGWPDEARRYLPQWANCLGLAARRWVVEG